MKKAFCIIIFITIQHTGLLKAQDNIKINTRRLWLNYLDKVAGPVMKNIAENKLKVNMPVVLSNTVDNKGRINVAYLEAFARTLSGIAPWLELEGGDREEIRLRNQYRDWALKGIANAVDPNAKDFLLWTGPQPLVDASFMALGLVRCPWLWQHMDTTVKNRIVTQLKLTRNTIPVYSNWILFSGMIEAFFCKYDQPYDVVRIEYALNEFTKHWYVGDGLYADGMNFHYDYYNSFVIHPYLATIMEVLNNKNKLYESEAKKLNVYNKRYAQILERLINTDGSFPANGRSIVYRGGAMHHLAFMALKKQLPATLTAAQVRCALTAVIKKTLAPPLNFNNTGWLNIGLSGSQPKLAEPYITTGSLYLCANIFLPLGLPATDEFWNSPDEPWTSVKIWNGIDVEADHALDIK